LDKERSIIKGHTKPGDKNQNSNEASIERSDASMKGKDQGNPYIEDSSGGDTTKREENAWLKGNKELEEITMEPLAHSTLLGSTIPTKNTSVEITGNAPSIEKIIDSSIRIGMGSTRDSG
jgi:hypothetical protein